MGDVARTSLENQEALLTTWDLLRAAFLDTFTSVVRKGRAETLLETHSQLLNENTGMYTEEMIRLFRHADLAMSEEKKIRFLMWGVKNCLLDLTQLTEDGHGIHF